MNSRELAGAINRSKIVWVWLEYGTEGEGMYVACAKSAARAIVEEAREKGADVFAEKQGKELLIGGPFEDEVDESDGGEHEDDEESDEADAESDEAGADEADEADEAD